MIPVQQIFYPHDYSVIWYPLTGFPGYEASITSSGQLYVRSLKQFNKYPFGDLIYPDSERYEMSNFNNQRVKVSINEVMELMDKTNPRYTDQVDKFKARNKRAFTQVVESPNVGTVVRNPKPIRRKNNEQTHFMPKFTIIKDITEGDN